MKRFTPIPKFGLYGDDLAFGGNPDDVGPSALVIKLESVVLNP